MEKSRQAAAVDRLEEIQQREAINCDFRRLDGYLFQALNTDSKIIEDEMNAVKVSIVAAAKKGELSTHRLCRLSSLQTL